MEAIVVIQGEMRRVQAKESVDGAEVRGGEELCLSYVWVWIWQDLVRGVERKARAGVRNES